MENSADGDIRALKAMRLLAKLGDKESSKEKVTALTSNRKLKIPGFNAEILPKQVCLQDAVHLGNKHLGLGVALSCRVTAFSE